MIIGILIVGILKHSWFYILPLSGSTYSTSNYIEPGDDPQWHPQALLRLLSCWQWVLLRQVNTMRIENWDWENYDDVPVQTPSIIQHHPQLLPNWEAPPGRWDVCSCFWVNFSSNTKFIPSITSFSFTTRWMRLVLILGTFLSHLDSIWHQFPERILSTGWLMRLTWSSAAVRSFSWSAISSRFFVSPKRNPLNWKMLIAGRTGGDCSKAGEGWWGGFWHRQICKVIQIIIIGD